MKVGERVAASRLRDAILDALPAKVSEIATATGRRRTDRTIRVRLEAMQAEGLVELIDGAWRKCRNDDIDVLPDYEFPAGWDDESREQFAGKITELVEADCAVDSFLIELLENYVRCLQRARTANRQVDEDGLFQKAAKGDRRFPHPGIAIAREAERDAHVYREAIDKKKRKEPGDADPDDDLAGLAG